MSGIVLTLLTGLTWYFVGVVFAGAPKDSRRLFSFFFLHSAVFLAATLVFVFGFRGIYPENWKEILVLTALIFPIALNLMLSFYLLKRAMECGPQSIAWSVMQFGFAGSYLLSVLFLNEKPTGMNLAGIFFISASILLFSVSMHRKAGKVKGFMPRRFCLLLLFAFLSTGFGNFLYMLPNLPALGLSANTLEFRAVLLPIPQLLWIIPALRERATLSDVRSVTVRACVYGLVVMLGEVLFFYALDAMDRNRHIGLTAPLALGSCVLIFFLYRVISRKERADLAMYLGLASGIAGILLMAKLN